MEKGEEAEDRKSKAFWLSIIFTLFLTCAVVTFYGIKQYLVKKHNNENTYDKFLSIRTNATTWDEGWVKEGFPP